MDVKLDVGLNIEKTTTLKDIHKYCVHSFFCSAILGRPRLSRFTGLSLHRMQRYGEVAAKLFSKVYRYPRVNTTLPLQKAALIIDRYDGTMPNIRMDVEALAAVAAESNELVRSNVIPW